MRRGNLLTAVPARSDGESFEQVLARGALRIERIVSFGQSSPEGFWYDQDEHEWVVVLRGRAGLQFEGRDEILELAAGDYVDIPAHVRHRVAWTAAGEPTIWLAVYQREP